ncbi:MAG: hypothetical protein WD042_17315 [Phycisphaeraceae bacterium]
MSIQGTTAAAGVAQTAHNAQQVARRHDQQRGHPARETRQIREVFETHLASLEESDQDSPPTHLHVDDQLPEEGQGQSQPDKRRRHPPEQAEAPQADAGDPPANPPTPGTLYAHLDLQA